MKNRALLHIIDHSSRFRAGLARIGFDLGYHSEIYSDLTEFVHSSPKEGIVIARDRAEDGGIPTFLRNLGRSGIWLPLIAMDREPGAEQVVASMKAGALDYLALPVDPISFEACLRAISDEAFAFVEARKRMIEARNRITNLSPREREVLDRLAAGGSNKVIAHELSISPRTVEIHRANMMAKLGAGNAAEAVRLRFEAEPCPFEKRALLRN